MNLREVFFLHRGIGWRNSLGGAVTDTELNRRWIFPHQSKSTPRTLPLSPFLLSPPRNSLGSYLPLMCAALSLCVHAPKSPLIPFICTAGIRIEDRPSKRVWTVVVLPAHAPPSQCIYAQTNRSFRSFLDFLKDIAVPSVVWYHDFSPLLSEEKLFKKKSIEFSLLFRKQSFLEWT